MNNCITDIVLTIKPNEDIIVATKIINTFGKTFNSLSTDR